MSDEHNNRLLPFTDEALDALLACAAKSEVESNIDSEVESARYKRIEARVLNQALPPKATQSPREVHVASVGFMRGIDALIDWLSPRQQRHWRPIFAAACPLVLGIVIGNYFHFGLTPTSEPSFESWDDELVMLSFLDISNQGEITEANEGEIR